MKIKKRSGQEVKFASVKISAGNASMSELGFDEGTCDDVTFTFTTQSLNNRQVHERPLRGMERLCACGVVGRLSISCV